MPWEKSYLFQGSSCTTPKRADKEWDKPARKDSLFKEIVGKYAAPR